MKNYIKNTLDNSIITLEANSYEQLSKNFRQAPYARATQNEIDAYKLQQAKAEKISQLKLARDKALSGSQAYSITIDGVSCSFSLSNSDLPVLSVRQSCLTSSSDTSGWNSIEGNRIGLNKDAFQKLIHHINANDISVWDLYTIALDNIKREDITLEELNNININSIFTKNDK